MGRALRFNAESPPRRILLCDLRSGLAHHRPTLRQTRT